MTYQTKGVCSRSIDITVDNGIIVEVRYHGGCAGNTQGVAALIKGMKIEEAIERLSGIRCGFKSTSCPDQLATALREYLAQK
ncbi:MAG: TIGR03905 family TSCPD domain-containing protein [Ruminococcaceae bacterium]|nr:TIGR03905 family TSCPD domain-containing protein [Oscillospiraceae bacterium]